MIKTARSIWDLIMSTKKKVDEQLISLFKRCYTFPESALHTYVFVDLTTDTHIISNNKTPVYRNS